MVLPFVKGSPISNLDLLSFTLDSPSYDKEQPVYVNAVDPSTSVSYSQAVSLIRQLIAGFHAAGLKQNDVVCIHSFNHIYYPVICLAIIGAGGIFVGTNPSYTQRELEHAVQSANIRFVLSEPEILTNINSALAKSGLDVGKQLFILNHRADQIVPQGLRSWRWLQKQGEEDWVRFNDQERQTNTTAGYFFTSGTTGLPKCAMITHRNLVAQHQIFWEPNPRTYKITCAHVFPLFHVGAFPTVIVSQLKDGRQAYIMPRFNLDLWLSCYDRFKLTEVFLAPPMVVQVVMSQLADPKSPNQKYSLKSVRDGYVGAAPLSGDIQKRFHSLLSPGARFTQIWGMTETCSQATSMPIPLGNRTTAGTLDSWGSIGQPLPHVDLKLIDPSSSSSSSSSPSTPLHQGEAVIKGPTIIRSYLNAPSATANSFTSDGYYRTGDIMRFDTSTSLLYIVERSKELLKVRGFQVAPAELEGVLTSHPDITDAAVVGVPDEKSGEVPRAYVVLRKFSKAGQQENQKADLGVEEIRKYMRERLAGYKALEGGVVFVDEIPKLPSGKILKRVIREWVEKENKQNERSAGSKL